MNKMKQLKSERELDKSKNVSINLPKIQPTRLTIPRLKAKDPDLSHLLELIST